MLYLETNTVLHEQLPIRILIMKIPQKYANLLFVFLTALCMSCLMSFVVTVSNVGFEYGFFGHWMKAWGFSFLIGYPIISFVIPAARKMVQKITTP